MPRKPTSRRRPPGRRRADPPAEVTARGGCCQQQPGRRYCQRHAGPRGHPAEPPGGVTVTRLTASARQPGRGAPRSSRRDRPLPRDASSRQPARPAARARAHPVRRQAGSAGAQQQQRLGRKAGDSQAGLLYASLQQQLGAGASAVAAAKASAEPAASSARWQGWSSMARGRRQQHARRSAAPASASSHNSGTNAAPTVIARPVAQAARRASFGRSLNIRPGQQADQRDEHEGDGAAQPACRDGAEGDRQQRVGRPPPRLAPARIVTFRSARNAVMPAIGTQPSSSTSTASQALPPSTVASSGQDPTYGGAMLAEPIPVGWNARRNCDHSPHAPSQAGKQRAAAQRAARDDANALRAAIDTTTAEHEQHPGTGQHPLQRTRCRSAASRRRSGRRWRGARPARSSWGAAGDMHGHELGHPADGPARRQVGRAAGRRPPAAARPPAPRAWPAGSGARRRRTRQRTHRARPPAAWLPDRTESAGTTGQVAGNRCKHRAERQVAQQRDQPVATIQQPGATAD